MSIQAQQTQLQGRVQQKFLDDMFGRGAAMDGLVNPMYQQMAQNAQQMQRDPFGYNRQNIPMMGHQGQENILMGPAPRGGNRHGAAGVYNPLF